MRTTLNNHFYFHIFRPLVVFHNIVKILGNAWRIYLLLRWYTEIVGKQLVNYSFQFHRTVEITGLSCNIFLFGCAIFVDSWKLRCLNLYRQFLLFVQWLLSFVVFDWSRFSLIYEKLVQKCEKGDWTGFLMPSPYSRSQGLSCQALNDTELILDELL